MAGFDQPISLTSDHLFADLATELLRQGKSVRFRAPGRSMYPTIKEEEIITVEPIEPSTVKKGDIILYRSEAGVVAHRVMHIIDTPPSTTQSLSLPPQSSVLSPHYFFILRDDTWGATSSQIEDRQVLGKVVAVERNGCEVDPYSEMARIRLIVHTIGSCIKRLMTG